MIIQIHSNSLTDCLGLDKSGEFMIKRTICEICGTNKTYVRSTGRKNGRKQKQGICVKNAL